MELNDLIKWLTAGGTLSSAGSVGGIALLLRFFVIPICAAVAKKLDFEIDPALKVKLIYGVSIATCYVVGYFTKSIHTVQALIVMGILSAQAAIGQHQTTILLPSFLALMGKKADAPAEIEKKS